MGVRVTILYTYPVKLFAPVLSEVNSFDGAAHIGSSQNQSLADHIMLYFLRTQFSYTAVEWTSTYRFGIEPKFLGVNKFNSLKALFGKPTSVCTL